MATLTHSGSRKYSWWLGSHVSPKNSKWLKENLTDMDSKIKSMIKIIEEDADSFMQHAEMYYHCRPVLTSLVEEIYHAYRALAQRYNHTIGALHQATGPWLRPFLIRSFSSINVESLQGLVKELKGSKFELKEIIKNHEDVKILHSENLRQLEMISEKNTLLEKFLYIANAELEVLREKEELELSSANLRSNIERMHLLENSLCVANAEIEWLRGKLKELNASYQFLMGENEKLEAEERSLASELHFMFIPFIFIFFMNYGFVEGKVSLVL